MSLEDLQAEYRRLRLAYWLRLYPGSHPTNWTAAIEAVLRCIGYNEPALEMLIEKAGG